MLATSLLAIAALSATGAVARSVKQMDGDYQPYQAPPKEQGYGGYGDDEDCSVAEGSYQGQNYACDDEDKSAFYICDHGKWVQMECAAGTTCDVEWWTEKQQSPCNGPYHGDDGGYGGYTPEPKPYGSPAYEPKYTTPVQYGTPTPSYAPKTPPKYTPQPSYAPKPTPTYAPEPLKYSAVKEKAGSVHYDRCDLYAGDNYKCSDKYDRMFYACEHGFWAQKDCAKGTTCDLESWSDKQRAPCKGDDDGDDGDDEDSSPTPNGDSFDKYCDLYAGDNYKCSDNDKQRAPCKGGDDSDDGGDANSSPLSTPTLPTPNGAPTDEPQDTTPTLTDEPQDTSPNPTDTPEPLQVDGVKQMKYSKGDSYGDDEDCSVSEGSYQGQNYSCDDDDERVFYICDHGKWTKMDCAAGTTCDVAWWLEKQWSPCNGPYGGGDGGYDGYTPEPKPYGSPAYEPKYTTPVQYGAPTLSYAPKTPPKYTPQPSYAPTPTPTYAPEPPKYNVAKQRNYGHEDCSKAWGSWKGQNYGCDDGDKSIFYQCDHGKWVEMSCARGTTCDAKWWTEKRQSPCNGPYGNKYGKKGGKW
ncbi:hypothetical protein HK101_004542 [Irineochytrium annulatum]|nr:hypothetical protein HK101_004542 [Irineochytrium annulatum]